MNLFSSEEKEQLLFIMKEPNRFYRTYYQEPSEATASRKKSTTKKR